MTRSIWLVLAFMLLTVAPVAAQDPHPCDAPDTTLEVLLKTKSFRLGFCHAQKDEDGDPIVITGFKLTIDSATIDLGNLSPIGGPNAKGWFYYEFPFTAGKGAHHASILAYVDDAAVGQLVAKPSNTLALRIVGVPGPAVAARIAGEAK
jgi:hypothetical protein